MAVPDYVRWLRGQVGSAAVQLNFAAACVTSPAGVLLQRRSDDGRWCCPGGAIEWGESAEEAVVREVAEETGLTVAVSELLGVYTKYEHRYPNGDLAQPIAMFFVCDLVGGQVGCGDESLDVCSFALDALPPLMNRQHEDALDDLRRGRRGVFR
jgi:mutator protein MutT